MKPDLSAVRLFLFDMDGTLYLGDRLFAFANSLLAAIREKGKRYLFITNNSSKSVKAYVEKLQALGVAATEDDFLTSSQATAHYLKAHHAGKMLYVCGTQSLKAELCENGFAVTDDPAKTECIVVGYDTELTYKKLWDISEMLETRDLPYIATNPDTVCPTVFGSVPDCGSICEMLFAATGKRPTVIGKPSPLMIRLAMEKARCTPQETAVVGDRIYTDVQSGINAGAVSVLVMSGETTKEILASSAAKPDFVLGDAGELIHYL